MRSRRSFTPVLAAAGTLVCLASAGSAWAGADLRLTNTADVEPAPSGGLLTYTLSVVDDGPDAAPNVVVVDTLPSQVTWFNDNCAGGPPVGQVVACGLGSIPAFGSASAQIQVVISPAATGTIVNLAS